MEQQRGIFDRLREWFRGRAPKQGPPREPSVWNQPAPASRAGDAPMLTSHGNDASHAH